MPTVTLVHAVLPALAPMHTALTDAIADVQVRHLLDEGLSSEPARRGGVDRVCVERMLTLLGLAVAAPSDAVVLTCTAYSTMLPEARQRYPQPPLLAVDEVMVETAVTRARRIGVLATFQPGLDQQRELLLRAANAQGKAIEVVPVVQPAAMDALRGGDAPQHDRILLAALPELLADCEIVLLAQVSMARVLPQVAAPDRDRVLSSPRLAAEALRRSFERVAADGAPRRQP